MNDFLDNLLAIRQRFYDEPMSDFQEIAKHVVPNSPAELGFSIATGPFGKATKLGGLALAAMGYSPDVDAGLARVGKGAIGFVRDYWPDATSAVRKALQGSFDTGNEYAVARTPQLAKVWTDSSPDLVRIPPSIANLVAKDPNRSFVMHTHPTGDVGPSAQDLLGNIGYNPVLEMISAPQSGNPFVAFRKYQPIGKDYDQYTKDVFHHVTSPQVKEFLTDSKFLNPDSLDVFDFAMKAGPHTYMRNLGLGDKIDYLYNDLGPLNNTNPSKVGDILDAYWNQFLPER